MNSSSTSVKDCLVALWPQLVESTAANNTTVPGRIQTLWKKRRTCKRENQPSTGLVPGLEGRFGTAAGAMRFFNCSVRIWLRAWYPSARARDTVSRSTRRQPHRIPTKAAMAHRPCPVILVSGMGRALRSVTTWFEQSGFQKIQLLLSDICKLHRCGVRSTRGTTCTAGRHSRAESWNRSRWQFPSHCFD